VQAHLSGSDASSTDVVQSAKAILVSVLIPLEDHRNLAERSIRAWCIEQTLDREHYEVIVVAPVGFPKPELARIEAMLGEHDRVLPATVTHDIELVAAAAAVARGEFFMFSESHVWPTVELLERCVARMNDHPEWAGLVCGVKLFTDNRLGEAEGAMYQRDFQVGMTELGWRNINDAGFFTRREPYAAAGGFDVSLGHFAEWVLAARYATQGFVVGQCPDIEMWHYYAGNITALRSFTENFVRGEIAYLARDPALRRETLIEAPGEWCARGDRRRDLARHMLRLLGSEVMQARAERRDPDADWRNGLRWIPRAVAGGWWERLTAEVQVVACRARLFTARSLAAPAVLVTAFERYIAAVIRRTRLRSSDRQVARRQPRLTGELWNAWPDSGDASAGFYDCEDAEGVPFRWSRPAAVIGLDIAPGPYRIRMHTLAVQLARSAIRPTIWFNGERVADPRVSSDGNTFDVRIEVRGGRRNWLGLICAAHSAPDDPRQLGIPLVSVVATLEQP